MTGSLLAEVKGRAFSALEDFESRGGVSVDPYHAEPSYHPMAEAKYLWALAELLDTGLVSSAHFRSRVGQAVERLTGADLAEQPRLVSGNSGLRSMTSRTVTWQADQ